MAKNVKFVLHRRAFRDQVLRGQGVDMERALREALPGDDVEVVADGTRMRAYASAPMKDEVESGALTRRLGGGP